MVTPTGMAASGGSSSGGSQGPASQQGSTSTVTSTPTSADAVAVINQSCSGCHSVNEALDFHAGSADEAQALIDNMIQRGAKLTAEQQQLLVKYFTR